MNRLTSGLIEFSYRTTDLHDKVQMYTQYPVRTKERNDEFMVTDDEATLVDDLLSRGFSEVFQLAAKLSFAVPSSLYLNVAVNFGGEAYTGYGFKLIDRHGYNENLPSIIDTYIQSLVVSFACAEWFRIIRSELYKTEVSNYEGLKIKYLLALTELYKPKIEYTEIIPATDEVGIDVDPDTGAITEVTETESTTTDVDEIVYYDTYADFPDPGVEDLMYIARDTRIRYYWSGTAYVAYEELTTSFSQEITGVTSLVFTHNLNKMMPYVVVTDGDGVEWEVDYTPTDANSGTATWTNALTGTLYAS